MFSFAITEYKETMNHAQGKSPCVSVCHRWPQSICCLSEKTENCLSIFHVGRVISLNRCWLRSCDFHLRQNTPALSISPTTSSSLCLSISHFPHICNGSHLIIRLVIFHLPIFYPASRCLPKSNLQVAASVDIHRRLTASHLDLRTHQSALEEEFPKSTSHR